MNNRLIPNTYSLYDPVYNEMPTDQFYVILFDYLPSNHRFQSTYDPKIKDYFLENGFSIVQEFHRFHRRYESTSQFLLSNEKTKMLVRITGNNPDEIKTKEFLVNLEIFYDRRIGKLEEQINFNEIDKFQKKNKKSNIQLVKMDMGHMDTQDYDLPIPKMNIQLNYGSDFVKVHNVIQKRLNKNYDKGIILLHGEPGSGKTTYIKYLSKLVKEKEILFIPPSMAEALSEPGIIPFLMDHKNSILIIEDAERVIADRELHGSSTGVSNILNLTDGILGDCLNIQIIATFNMMKEKIDKALLRKGRLIAEHKFDKLSIQDTNNLLRYLKKDFISNEPMCLADIYNVDTELYKTNEKLQKIGFVV
jgi:energy-coupling factor transporter ATP-binding protein EcfA2